MSHIKTRAFVLRDQPIGEADKLIALLTADSGLITAFARGARRTKSSLLAGTQIFSLADFDLFNYRGRYCVDSALLDSAFLNLQKDLDRLVCASHLAEVFIDVLSDDVPNRMAYEIWAYTAHELQTGKDPLLSVHVAQLRLLAESGLKPAVDNCRSCGCQISSSAFFSFSTFSANCINQKCRVYDGSVVELSSALTACLQYIFSCKLAKLFSFQLTDQVREELIGFSDKYLTIQMEKKYSRLDMLKNLEGDNF